MARNISRHAAGNNSSKPSAAAWLPASHASCNAFGRRCTALSSISAWLNAALANSASTSGSIADPDNVVVEPQLWNATGNAAFKLTGSTASSSLRAVRTTNANLTDDDVSDRTASFISETQRGGHDHGAAETRGIGSGGRDHIVAGEE